MTYFLDFDRTVFATDPFKEYLYARPELAEHSRAQEADFARALNEKVRAGDLAFAEGELARFVYPDAAEFLRAHGDDAVIVTFGNAALQQAKVENALRGLPLRGVHYTGDTRKGDYMRERIGAYDAPFAFADDTPHELEGMRAALPEVALFEIRRDGGAGDGRFPVIRSLAELP